MAVLYPILLSIENPLNQTIHSSSRQMFLPPEFCLRLVFYGRWVLKPPRHLQICATSACNQPNGEISVCRNYMHAKRSSNKDMGKAFSYSPRLKERYIGSFKSISVLGRGIFSEVFFRFTLGLLELIRINRSSFSSSTPGYHLEVAAPAIFLV